ncbi:hypothetical protein HD806DRAFT_545834 [Xylariaceae sp. AK1471]|nr:hypothetical protein HD806DRAFT_545834 [Xylariaceae sp. AK1471]
MHRRNSTNPRRLNRRKSAASVKSVHLEYISPETAERDAQVAATQAFTRARERSATDATSTLWPPPRSNGPGGSIAGYSPQSKTRSDESHLRREQSIRFVQPRPSHLEPSRTSVQDTSPSRIFQAPKRHTTDIEADKRPSGSTSASGMVAATKGAAGDYINTLFAGDEYYTPEDDIASMPSSYRRLRKTKSMFTNRATATAPQRSKLSKSSASTNQLPSPADSHFLPPDVDENVPPLGLKTPRSMSFLRDFRGSFGPASRYEDNYTSLPSTSGFIEYRDQTKSALRPKPSRFFRSKTSGQERIFKKSMREVSNGTASMNGEAIKDGSLRHKARKVSQGLKHKLKNLFGLVKGDSDETTFPLQHIEAQKSHILGLRDMSYDPDNELRRVPSADQGALSYVASGIPSLHAVPSYQRLRSRQGSMESLRSEQNASDERSRVTSWSDSDTNTVITFNSCREERERKRLSVIKENGAHICSSSTHFAPISEQSNPSTASLQQPAQVPTVAVDGRRIYSALMKRMDQSQQTHTSDIEKKSSVDDLVQLRTVPRRKNSLRLRRLGCNTTTATIRYVMPESESDSEPPKANKGPYMKDKIGSPSVGTSSPPLATAIGPKEGRPDLSAFASMNMDTGDVSSKDADNNFLSAPTGEEGPALVRTLSSRSSAFFGSPTRHVFRSKSPYRRALQEKMHTATNEQPIRSPDFNPWMRSLSSLPIRRSSTCGSDADIKMTYTESIYSTNSEEYPSRRRSALSVVEDFPRPSSTHGDVTIFVNPPEYNKRSSSLPPKQRVSSTSSSVEWKMWLSSNVSKLEESTTHVDAADFQYDLLSGQSSRHVRENAQINDEEEDHVSDSCQAKGNGFLNLDQNNEDNQPRSFDFGEKYSAAGNSQISFPDPLPAGISAEQSDMAIQNTVRGPSGADLEKALPKVPSISSSGNRSNITMKLVKRQLKSKNSIVPLANRSISGTIESQPGKGANSQRKIDNMASAKTENVSPAAAHNHSDDDPDPYGIEGSGVLGPNQQTLGSKRMVDIFLSSRRRRMASTDEGSVFL